MSKTNRETRYLVTDVEIRAEEDNQPRLVGYAARFNSLSEDLGGFREVIRKGAFADSIRRGDDVRALVDHNPTMILGRTKSNTLTLSEDNLGLRVEILLPDTSVSRDLQASMKRGDIDGMSFGFRVDADAWREEQGQTIRELHRVSLFDVSPVTFPAYPATEAALRSLSKHKTSKGTPALRKARLRLAESL